jgi:selenoprotein W-related protein
VSEPAKPSMSIEYCPRCGWLLRASWLAQELLTTFAADLERVSLVPAPETGVFRISVGTTPVWCRKLDGGFPQAAELKRRVRDVVAPGRPLGHSEGSRDGE